MTANIYARIFDASNKNWSNSAEHNKMFLQVMESYANDMLQARGHVFLNDIYDCLGFTRTSVGAVVGWFKEPGGKFIDFKMTEQDNGSIFLEFEVDGVMYNKLPNN